MSTLRLFNNHIRTSFAILAVCESIIVYCALLLAIAIRFRTFDLSSTEVLQSIGNVHVSAFIFMVLHMLAMVALGLYQADQFKGRNGFLQMVSRFLVSLFLASIALMVIFYIIPSLQVGRGVIAIGFFVCVFGILIARRIFYLAVNADGDAFATRVLVLGVGNTAASLFGEKDKQAAKNYKMKGFVSTPEQSCVVPPDQVTEMGDSLLAIAKERGVNEIIVALDDRRIGYPVQQLLECKLSGIKITDPVSFFERELGKVNLAHLNPSWVIFSDGFTVSFIKSTLSRFFDIAASLIILTLTAPILLVTAFLIALEGGFREPIFYRQERVGKNGQTFELLKFRSMRVNAEANGAQWAAQNDARVTRIGKFIRKVRIDELPQILNILKGDMRLVGPRPERPEFVSKLSQSISMYSQRHSVKPGLAGWAQLKYPYGATEEDAYEKLQYDLYYIKNANPVMDFFILLQTLEVVLFGKGAR